MSNPFKNISAAKIAGNVGDAAVNALEVYKMLLNVKYSAAEELGNVVNSCKNSALAAKLSSFAQNNTCDKIQEEPENIKEKPTMKKSTFWSFVAFVAAVCAAAAAVAYYFKKKQAELEEYDDMLFNEDYLADYMPKDDEYSFDETCCCEDDCCCEEVCEETCEAPAEE